MRYAAIVLLLTSAALCTACSTAADFAVVNKSGQPIEIRYRIKGSSSDSLYLTDRPAKVAASQLDGTATKWQVMPPDQYQVDQGLRTVIVRVMPGEALLIERVADYHGHDEPGAATYFFIEELTVTGAEGELNLSGQQVRKMFVLNSEDLYTLTYK